MNKILLIVCLIGSTAMIGQTPSDNNPRTGVISGKVIDNTTNEALPYVTIVIKNLEDDLTTGGISDDKGMFTVKQVPEGENLVEIQFIGYKTETSKITITRGKTRVDMGTISLSEEATELNEVLVVAETSTVIQKVDRKVINVGKDLTSTGATASELLNNVQSVSVDGQTGNLSLRGNENVRVLVDGKPTNINTAQLLKQIPSTSIKSIELITNPSAKYNPEGMSGIINIVLHKNANLGFNGSVNTGITFAENTKFNGSLDMNLKTGKVNFFMNYGYNTGKNANYGYIDRVDNNSHQDFDFLSDRDSHLLKFGADIYLNDKNTISVYTLQNKSEDLFKGLATIYFNSILNSDSPLLVDSENNAQTYNFNYKIDFEKKGHNLEFEANFSDSESPQFADHQEYVRPYNLTSNYDEDVENDRNTTLLNLDYVNPLSDKSKLELGLEVRLNDTKNLNVSNQEEFVFDNNGNMIPDGTGWYETTPRGNSSFQYDREILSAYANYSQQFDKFTMQLGARLEEYNIEGTFVKNLESASYKDEIFSIYPSVFFTFNPSEKNQFQVSYSRRVDRPSIQQVNPIREWSTPLITSVGNPDLKPQFTNSFELNYTRQYEGGSLTFGTFFRRVNDNISRSINTDPLDADKLELTYTNYDSNNRYGIEVSSNHKMAKWWRVNASFDLYTQKENGIANGEALEVTNNSLNFRVSNSFTATQNLRFQLFALYRAGVKSVQFEADPMWMLNAGASLNVLKRKGTISLRSNDIFKGMKSKFRSDKPYSQSGQFNWESQATYIGFMYRFGGGKNKAKKRKVRDNNEVQGGGFI